MLQPAPGSLQIDATLGGGGHTERILEASNPDGRLLGLDADGAAVARVVDRLGPRFGDRLVVRQANFRELATVAPEAGFGAVDGALFDLGLSSFQLADETRGFGFRTGGPLDMRFDTDPRRPGCRAACDARRRRADGPVPALRRGAQGRPDRPGHRRGAADRAGPDRRGARRPDRARGAAEPAPAASDAPRDPCLPGPADRGQRGARGARGRPRRGGRPPPSRWPARRPQLPLARGPDRQAVPRGGTTGLRLPAGGAGLRLRTRTRACAS